MLRPRTLKQGDRIAIIATAKKLLPGQIDGALDLIRSWGLNVVLGHHLNAADRQFAGTDAQRRSDVQAAIDDPSIRAVIFARGGYGTARLLDGLNWDAFKESPKWLCGFSDLTALHSHVEHLLQCESLHASMPIFFADGTPNEGSDSLRDALFGTHEEIRWDAHPMNRNGQAEGALVGGNLAVLTSIAGSASEMDLAGKILFLEDLTEYYYRMDRMVIQLQRSGALSQLAGLVIGQFTEMIDNEVSFGRAAEEILLEAVLELNIPVACQAPIGHVTKNLAVYHGRQATLEVGNSSLIKF